MAFKITNILLENKLRKTVKLVSIGLSIILVIGILNSLPISVTAQTPTLPTHVEGNKIVDSSGQILILRGVQVPCFASQPAGAWSGYTIWNQQDIINELDAIKSWGANTIRLQIAIEYWKYNLNTPNLAITNRDAIKLVAQLAAQRGMYVILTGYSVKGSSNGGQQDPLPYPPFQTSPGASSVIANKQDFVYWWNNVASELKNYPNLMFEIWNEPTLRPFGLSTITANTVQTEYFTVVQEVINSIRTTGAMQPILTQWDYSTWVDLDYPWNPEATMNWITTANLNDPAGNIVYVTHIYRQGGSTGIYSIPESIQQHGSNYAWEYDQIKLALQYERIDWVINTLNKPMFITETGCNIDLTGIASTQELTGWNNLLTILNQWDIGYIAHVWTSSTQNRLITNDQTYLPSQSGEILKEKLAYVKQQDLTNTPTTNPILTKVAVSSTTASSSEGINTPNRAIDGIETTSNYWGTNALATAGQLPQWLQLDIGTQTTISQIITHFYDGDSRTYTYYIQASTDGSTWNTIVPTKTDKSIVTDAFTQITARYIRINIIGNTANLAAHIGEVKIYQSTNPTFYVGNRLKNVRAQTDFRTITSIKPVNCAEGVYWNSKENYRILFDCATLILMLQ
jgi:hypothetical protein